MEIWVHLTEQDTPFGQISPSVSDRHCSLPCPLVFSILIAIPLGIMSAYKPYTAWDYISSAFSFIGAAIPNFFAGLVFVYLLSVVLKIFPSGGMYDTSGVRTLPMLLHHLFLPMLVLSIQQVGSLIRQTRGAMLDVLQEDYIRTARAKGALEGRVLLNMLFRTHLSRSSPVLV